MSAPVPAPETLNRAWLPWLLLIIWLGWITFLAWTSHPYWGVSRADPGTPPAEQGARRP